VRRVGWEVLCSTVTQSESIITMGVGVWQTEHGLMVPIVKDADTKGLGQISSDVKVSCPLCVCGRETGERGRGREGGRETAQRTCPQPGTHQKSVKEMREL
jgi:hypothetical protein